MNVTEVKLSEITPYGNNPRKNDAAVDKVAASIREFGVQQPIVVDKDGVIIVGHTRYRAAKKLGLDTFPAVVADLPEEKAKAYRLADNKTGEFAEWDLDLLEQELDELLDVDFDMEEFGFLEEGVQSAEAIDLDEPERNDKNKNVCHCPKCGFEFEI